MFSVHYLTMDGLKLSLLGTVALLSACSADSNAPKQNATVVPQVQTPVMAVIAPVQLRKPNILVSTECETYGTTYCAVVIDGFAGRFASHPVSSEAVEFVRDDSQFVWVTDLPEGTPKDSVIFWRPDPLPESDGEEGVWDGLAVSEITWSGIDTPGLLIIEYHMSPDHFRRSYRFALEGGDDTHLLGTYTASESPSVVLLPDGLSVSSNSNAVRLTWDGASEPQVSETVLPGKVGE